MLDFSGFDIQAFQKYHEATVDAMTYIEDHKYITEKGAEYASRGINQVLYTLVKFGIMSEDEFEKYANEMKAVLKAKI